VGSMDDFTQKGRAAGSLETRPRLVALRAGRLFDGTADALHPDPVVVLEGATIISVGFGVSPPPGAEVVDLGTATLMPGLVDTHVHLAFDASPDPVSSLAARSDDEVLAGMRHAAGTALQGGVTTVRDLGDRDYLSLRLRDEAGLPTIVAAGPPITTRQGHCHFLGGVAEPGVAGLRAVVREHVDRGVDVIKIMASGGQLTPGTYQHQPQFSTDELRAAVDEAHRHGVPVTAHAHATQAISNAVAAGVDGIEHASFWSEDGVDDPGELVELLAARRIAVGATVGFVPVPGVAPPPGIVQRMGRIVVNMRRLYDAGVLIVAGSDAGIAPIKPHDAVRSAAPQLTALGMSAIEVLQTVTSVGARVCGLAATKGRIAPGYDADLLALDGDPVQDLAALHRIVAVYRLGTVVDRSPR
jgi:imidazolonepropionase-like amidohydrolase